MKCTKKIGQVRDSIPLSTASQTSKNPDQPLCQVVAEVTSLVWQLAEATAYEAYKICHFVGLKKRKASAIVCVFTKSAD